MFESNSGNRPRALARVRFSGRRILSHAYSLLSRRQKLLLGKVPGVPAIYHWFLRRSLSPPLTKDGFLILDMDGFRMYWDPRGLWGSQPLWGFHEPATSFVFKALLREADTAIDIGAHYGYFTLLAASLCGKAGSVYAFEPHPGNFLILRKNVMLNNFSNVYPIQKAVSNRSAIARLFLSKGSGQHSLVSVPPGTEASPGHVDYIDVETVTIDDYFRGKRVRPRIVKMDVEGAEPAAVEGMERLIGKNPQMALIIEFNPSYLQEGKAMGFLRSLTELRFAVAMLDDPNNRIAFGSPRELFVQIERKRYSVNLLCARQTEIFDLLFTCRGYGTRLCGSPR